MISTVNPYSLIGFVPELPRAAMHLVLLNLLPDHVATNTRKRRYQDVEKWEKVDGVSKPV